jgi:hypothetical protein
MLSLKWRLYASLRAPLSRYLSVFSRTEIRGQKSRELDEGVTFMV